MQNVISVWTALDARRRVIVVLATIAVFAAVLLLSRMAAQPSMSLLYAGLDGPASGEVVSSLEQQNVPYEVRGNAIYVVSSRRDELRMTLASEGLPSTGGAGYELLDSMTGFGTTAQMFDAAYRRATEGELARTIMSSPLVRSARVHISNPGQQVFQRGQTASASVAVTPANGAITGPQARAFANLVASAVTGLSAENVSVIDATSNTVIGTDDQNSAGFANGFDRAAEMKKGVQRLLEAHVGAGKAMVEISIETETASEEVNVVQYDAEGSTPISVQTEELSNNSTGAPNANVTVASNLPDGDANASGEGSTSQTSEVRESKNIVVPETTRRIVKAPGDIKRMTIAVLVDGVSTVDDEGQSSWAPRPEEDMAALKDLVAAAVGYNEERGDTLTIKSMQFTAPPIEGTSAEPGLIQSLGLDVMHLIQLAILALVALAISMFVIRPIFARDPAPQAALTGPDGIEGAVEGAALGDGALGEIDGAAPGALPDLGGVGDFDFDFDNDGGFEGLGSADDEDPVARLRNMIENRQSETVEVLRGWMEGEKEQA